MLLLLLLLLKIRRNVKRLNSAIVLRLDLLHTSLSLMSLVNASITRDTSSTYRIIQETFGAYISVLKFILDV